MSDNRRMPSSLSNTPGRVIVLGYIVRGPIGGMTWHYLNYVAGFARLGWDVLFVEDSDDYESCYDPERHIVSADATYGLAYTEAVFQRIGLPDRWAYFDAHTNQWRGPRGHTKATEVRASDLLLSVSGINPLREWMLDIPVRILVDTDPAFTQIKHLQNASLRQNAEAFTHYFTFGENMGRDRCTVPGDGFPWRPTRQPIAMELWPPSTLPPSPHRFTTVMQWDSYDTLQHNGCAYGMKSINFDSYFNLPQRVAPQLELALGSPDAPRPQLQRAGWSIVDPLRISKTPWTYQQYLQSSSGEFSVAKHGYVATRSGWFSERSACYLATGRPVILQDTGYADFLPTGAGLFAFTTPDEANEALTECNNNLARHATAARDLAGAFFDSGVVLRQLLHAI